MGIESFSLGLQNPDPFSYDDGRLNGLDPDGRAGRIEMDGRISSHFLLNEVHNFLTFHFWGIGGRVQFTDA
jgi:hypothetical protein